MSASFQGNRKHAGPPNDLNPTFGLNKRARTSLGNTQNQAPCPYVPSPPRWQQPNNMHARPSRPVAPLCPTQRRPPQPFTIINASPMGQPVPIYQQQFNYNPQQWMRPPPPQQFVGRQYSGRPEQYSGQQQQQAHPSQIQFDSPYFYSGPGTSQAASTPEPQRRPDFPSSSAVCPTPAAPRVRQTASSTQGSRRKSMPVLTGTVDKILLWNKKVKNHTVLYEVIGTLDYVRTGNKPFQKVFMMRDGDGGPVLKVIFYEIDRPLIQLEAGEMVKVVGAMVKVEGHRGQSYFQAYLVLKSSPDELNLSQRVLHICDRAINELANSS